MFPASGGEHVMRIFLFKGSVEMKPLWIFILAWAMVPALAAQEPADTVPQPPRFFETGTDVYKIVEEMPRFPGCEDLATRQQKEDCSTRKMLEFLYSNLPCPTDAVEKGFTGGTSVIGFIVEKDGSLSHFQILRDAGGGSGEECLRVIQLMPNWIPGKQRGQPVRVAYNIPLKIRVE
jgi:periplasmic protein TonB